MGIKIGDRFEMLEVIGISYGAQGGIKCDCICDCGRIREFKGSLLLLGMNKSCGCLVRKHNMSNSRLYMIWWGMKERCRNPKSNGYSYYGGRGITYDEKWEDFQGFYTDMIEGYSENLSLDRIEVDGNYCKENCRWADAETQANNKRNTILYEYKGEQLSTSQLSRKYGINYQALRYRLKAGWDIEKAINKSVKSSRV